MKLKKISAESESPKRTNVVSAHSKGKNFTFNRKYFQGLALLEAQEVFPVEVCSGASATRTQDTTRRHTFDYLRQANYREKVCLSNLRSQLLVQDKYLNDYCIFKYSMIKSTSVFKKIRNRHTRG